MKKLKTWLPVDWYNGGMEHVTLHLLYSRFWHKFLFDEGFVPTSEPYKKRTAHGFVLASDGQKMSKSRGNVINPDSVVKTLGADTLRIYEMFMGPFAEAISWNMDSVAGSRRFVERIWRAFDKVSKNKKEQNEVLARAVNQTVKKVSEDYEEMKFNTSVSAMMILLNEFEKAESIPKELFETYLILLSPMAPHITEELWEMLGNGKSIHLSSWPKYKLDHNKNVKIKIVVQVNGKVRDAILVMEGASDEEIKELALQSPNVSKWLVGQEIKKVFVVKNRLINFVI
jgi:leucyl-tRNA synthetase